MLWFILQQLKSSDPVKRRMAAEKLGEIQSPRGLPGLVNALSDSSPEVRVAAVNAIGTFDDERKREPLLRAFRDPKPEVRLAVLNQLKNCPGDQVTNVLISALRDGDAVVRARAARILDQSSWQPTDVEDEVWLAISRGKLSRAAGHGSAAIRPLESILHDESSRGMHIAAIEALGSIPDERVTKSLVRALRTGDQTVCIAAIEALANTGGPNVINDLAPLLKHPDNRIRCAAIEALARFDVAIWVEEFRSLLRDPIWDVRCTAANVLSKSPDLATVDALISTLKDKYEDVRCAAVNSLGRIRDERAISPLVLALKDPGTNVRKMASGALRQIDPDWARTEAARRVIPELRAALASTDWLVRNAAATALKQLGEEQSQAGATPSVTEMATPARRRQQVVLGAFVSLLQDIDSDLRLAAALSLGQLRDRQARSPLMSALSDTDPLVRHAATEALHNLGVE